MKILFYEYEYDLICTKIRVNMMLDSSLRIDILNNSGFEMITCYLKAPTVGLMKFLIQFISFHFIFLFDYGLKVVIK